MSETGEEGKSEQSRPDPPLIDFWWLHDARWYQGVARRFGQEVANEINAEAIRFVMERVARWYTTTRGVNFPELPMEEFVNSFSAIPKLSWTSRMMDFYCEVRGADEWETVVTKHFNLRMLRAAGALEGYECPCLEMRAGWFEGMGVSVRDSKLECKIDGSSVCRFRAIRERPSAPLRAPEAASTDAPVAQ